MESKNKSAISSLRVLIVEEINLVAGGTGPGQSGPTSGGVLDGGTGDSGCIPVPNLGAD